MALQCNAISLAGHIHRMIPIFAGKKKYLALTCMEINFKVVDLHKRFSQVSLYLEKWYYVGLHSSCCVRYWWYTLLYRKLGNIFTDLMYKLHCDLRSFQIFSSHLFQIKQHLLSTVLLSGFQSSPGVLKLSKAVLGKFHEYGRHSKCSDLQDRAKFHNSRAWQIVLILNTDALMLLVEGL